MNHTGHSARNTVHALHDIPNSLPQIDPAHAHLTRLLCDGRFEARLRQLCGITEWQVAPASTAAAHDDLCWVDLHYDGGRLSIGLDAAQYPALAALSADPRGGDTHEGGDAAAPLACAVAGLLLTPLIDLIESLGAPGVSVASLSRRAPKARHAGGQALAVRCVRNAGHYACRLGQVERSWLELIERQLGMHRLPFTQRVSEIRVPGYLLVGERRLTIKTLGGLRPGDVVLRAASPALRALDGTDAASDLELRWGPAGTHQFVARVTLDGQHLVLNTDPTMIYTNDRPDLGTTDAESSTSIDELDLPVKFEIETVTLPLVQLSALRAGYVLELPATLRDARVRLVSYGQLIGIGELVTVGEQMGVRVIEMFGSHDAN
jgi:type III secretion protein Q